MIASMNNNIPVKVWNDLWVLRILIWMFEFKLVKYRLYVGVNGMFLWDGGINICPVL